MRQADLSCHTPLDWRGDRLAYSADHGAFREQVRRFLAREVEVNGDRWEREGVTDRAFWRRGGALGMLAPQVPSQWGGPGLDITYGFIVAEEIAYAGAPNGFQTHSDVCVDYLLHYGSEAVKSAWLEKSVTGEAIAAVALTEPDAGSDLRGLRTTAKRAGEAFVLDGQKTYISNGQNADYAIVAAQSAESSGLTLLVVDMTSSGVRRGRNLDKIGQHGADTSELFFDQVYVPANNVLGEQGAGLRLLVQQLPQERLSIAVGCQAGAQRAFDEAVRFTRDRRAFGRQVIDFQNTRFVLADLQSRLQVGWAHLDWAIARHTAGRLTAEQAAAAKLWHAETQWQIVDAALQLHGGAGYMNEYPIAKLWRDARVTRIYGGTSEIMKEMIGRKI